MSIFSKFDLSAEQQRKGRRILRELASREFFGDAENLLVRIVATNIDKLDLIEEAEKMQSWCKENRKAFSVLRFNNWTKRASDGRKPRVEDEISRELRKVEEFRKHHATKREKKVS